LSEYDSATISWKAAIIFRFLNHLGNNGGYWIRLEKKIPSVWGAEGSRKVGTDLTGEPVFFLGGVNKWEPAVKICPFCRRQEDTRQGERVVPAITINGLFNCTEISSILVIIILIVLVTVAQIGRDIDIFSVVHPWFE
jgi:hypothetical protein